MTAKRTAKAESAVYGLPEIRHALQDSCMIWKPSYRLNTCNQEDCGHYLTSHKKNLYHELSCRVPGCQCTAGEGRKSPTREAISGFRQRMRRRLKEGIVQFI